MSLVVQKRLERGALNRGSAGLTKRGPATGFDRLNSFRADVFTQRNAIVQFEAMPPIKSQGFVVISLGL